LNKYNKLDKLDKSDKLKTKCIPLQFLYVPKSVVVFIGEDNSGHYIVYLRNDGVWRRYDEDRVTLEDEDRVFNGTAPYLILLERLEPEEEKEEPEQVRPEPSNGSPDQMSIRPEPIKNLPEPISEPETDPEILDVTLLFGRSLQIGSNFKQLSAGNRVDLHTY
jgi:hypothetical protein